MAGPDCRARQLDVLEEEAAANAVPAFVAPPPTEPNQWALQGRSEQMSGRQLMQLRAFNR